QWTSITPCPALLSDSIRLVVSVAALSGATKSSIGAAGSLEGGSYQVIETLSDLPRREIIIFLIVFPFTLVAFSSLTIRLFGSGNSAINEYLNASPNCSRKRSRLAASRGCASSSCFLLASIKLSVNWGSLSSLSGLGRPKKTKRSLIDATTLPRSLIGV